MMVLTWKKKKTMQKGLGTTILGDKKIITLNKGMITLNNAA